MADANASVDLSDCELERFGIAALSSAVAKAEVPPGDLDNNRLKSVKLAKCCGTSSVPAKARRKVLAFEIANTAQANW